MDVILRYYPLAFPVAWSQSCVYTESPSAHIDTPTTIFALAVDAQRAQRISGSRFGGWVCALCAGLGDHGDRVYVSRGARRGPTWPLDLRTGSKKGWGESTVPQNSSELRVKQHRSPPASPGPRITPSVRERCCVGPALSLVPSRVATKHVCHCGSCQVPLREEA